MGILDYVKIGTGAVLLLALTYLAWNYQHMKTVIEAQQVEIGNLQQEQKILAEKQGKLDEYLKKSATVRKRVANEQKEITQEVDSVDDAGLSRLYGRYRVQPTKGVRPAPDGRKGGAKAPTPGSP